MIGLRKILKIADANTLVLSDELTKGTEAVSATSIFASAALELAKRNCKFIFTTHLTDVAKLDDIKDCKNIKISHLSVTFDDSQIIFERKLREGPCDELYGLEVAKAIGLDNLFIEAAFKIRNNLINKSYTVVASRRSRYNSKKILDVCEICNWKPTKKTDIPLDCHHIKFQCTANDQKFTGHYHKDALFNLVTLCKMCHIKVHNDQIVINGYKQTTGGVKLDFFIK
jgi:DNA mismatch repair protein MutS